MNKTLRVMDSSGDSMVKFDETEATAKAAAEAKALFERMIKDGAAVFAVNRGEGQPDKRVKNFNELEQENLIVPRLAGG